MEIALPTAHATVATTRPSRYLTQLCQHVDHLGRRTDHRSHLRQGDLEHTPPGTPGPVTWTDTAGMIDLRWGRCTLTAEDNALVLHAEAPDDANLHRLQAMLSARLHQIGRRDKLTVTWQPTATSTTPAPAAVASHRPDVAEAGRRGRHRGKVTLVAVGVLVIAAHVGLGAAAVTSPAWTGWAIDAVLAVVVVKLLASIVVGRRIIHRRRR
jgi:hypothetical protein